MDAIDQELWRAIETCDLAAFNAWHAAHPGRIDLVRDASGRTPLHVAANSDNYVFACRVADAMADVFVRDDRGLLAIDYPPGEFETDARRCLRKTFEGYERELMRMFDPPHPAVVSQPIDSWRRKGRYRVRPDGKSALMIACEASRPEVVKRLLTHHANPRWTDWAGGRTAAHFAIEADAADCLKALLEADASLRDSTVCEVIDGIPATLSPLHLASWKGKTACVAVLLASGVAIDARSSGDRHAWTSLHFAALAGHRDVVAQLLAAGADPRAAEACEGFNALQLAIRARHDAVVGLFNAWAETRKLDLLAPLFDPRSLDARFPLYAAPVQLARGRCVMCGEDKRDCVFPEYLVTPCPSCEKPRTWATAEAGTVERCNWCERQANWPDEWPRAREELCVCVDCLRAGRAAFSHSTELGTIYPPMAIQGMLWGSANKEEEAKGLGYPTTVLKTYPDGSQRVGRHLPQPLIDDLMRTLPHPTLQEEHWRIHCGGWMTYVGKWEAQDFERRAPGRAYEWFAEHIFDPEDAELFWDFAQNDTGWSCVFRCPSCGLHKVFYDYS